MFSKCVAWIWAARIIVRFIFILHLLSTFLCSISAITSAMRSVYTYGFLFPVLGTLSLWRNKLKYDSKAIIIAWFGLLRFGLVSSLPVCICVWPLYSNSLSATAPMCCRFMCGNFLYHARWCPEQVFPPHSIEWKSIFYYVYAIFLIEFPLPTMETRNIQKQIITYERHEWAHIFIV